ncbi:sel1 repeat family protein [Pseudomonas sp. TH41]|uniref:tetratricopeptide repeat protein n=1 Tax=Pseudomonas sp. TH41 TaxID=2796405 RepID=UPI0019129358|nr:sel1 repeat family protein [Pseudomonas sp. TH41]MBK5351743.1 sel1 repeat family protein [Pseudomonas sp. TH41]
MYTHSDALTMLFGFLENLNALIKSVQEQQESAKKQAMDLYNLGEFTHAEAFLKIPACAGDAAAQFALGEIFRRRDKKVTDEKKRDKTVIEEAKKWYALAAAQNHVYALMRLADEDSLKNAKALAQTAADGGSGEAMLQMYELTNDIEWLKKSADANFQEGQYLLARRYDKDETLITDAVTRRTTVNTLLEKAANAGFSKAMLWYGNRPPVSNDKAAKRQWLEKRTQLNDVNAVLDYGYALAFDYTDEEDADEYGFERDVVKGYGLVWLVVDTTREFLQYDTARTNLEEIGKGMTAAQIQAAIAFAQEWKSIHVSMSEYRLTYNEDR